MDQEILAACLGSEQQVRPKVSRNAMVSYISRHSNKLDIGGRRALGMAVINAGKADAIETCKEGCMILLGQLDDSVIDRLYEIVHAKFGKI